MTTTTSFPLTGEAAAPTRVTSPRSAARWAVSGYLAIFVLAIFANFLALGSVLDPGDAEATASALAESHTTVRIGAVAFLAIFLLDVVLAWALHVMFRQVHHDLSLLAAWARLTYTVVLGAAVAFLFQALLLVSDPELAGSGSDEQVLMALRLFDLTWVAGLAAFGLHLIVLGRLLLMTQRVPAALGWVLMMAGAAYIVDTAAHLVLADYEAWSGVFLAIVAVPSVVGELSLTIWLLMVAVGRRPTPVARTA